MSFWEEHPQAVERLVTLRKAHRSFVHIAAALSSEFGVQITKNMVCSKANRMDAAARRGERKFAPWTPEEDQAIRDLFPLCEDDDEIAERISRMGRHRTGAGVRNRRLCLAIYRPRQRQTNVTNDHLRGWPKVPPADEADRIFLAAIARELTSRQQRAAA